MGTPEPRLGLHPRPHWEAVDLGVALFRRHAGLLMGSWALLSLPLLGLLSLVFRDDPGYALLSFWLAKPLLERLPLLILSQALFADPPTPWQALRAWPRAARGEWLASLTWRRLQLTRAFDLPVLQLEALRGAARRARLTELRPGQRAMACWLTVLGASLESLLWLAILGGIYLLLPDTDKWSLAWLQQLAFEGIDADWMDHLANLGYALLLCLLEPLYVACSFSLYLNRRCQFEAWDLQWRLPGLLPPLRQLTACLLLAPLLGGLLLLSRPALADAASPAQPRLQQQALSSQAAQRAIGTLLGQPPFGGKETRISWHFTPPTQARLAPSAYADTGLEALEVLLWGTLCLALLWLVRRHQQWRGLLTGRNKTEQVLAKTALLPYRNVPTTLPADLAGAARTYWPHAPRQALGLLYRGLLQRSGAHAAQTEFELLRQLAGETELADFATQITTHYCDQAYGARTLSDAQFEHLLLQWHRLDQDPRP